MSAAHSPRAPEIPPPEIPPAEVCKAIRKAGIASVSPGNMTLLALLGAGATVDEFVDAAQLAVGKGKGFAYALAIVEGRRKDAAQAVNGLHRGPMPQNRGPPRQSATERQIETMNALTGKDRRNGPANSAAERADIVDVDARDVE